MIRKILNSLLVIAAWFICSCSTVSKLPAGSAATISQLRLLGEYDVAHNLQYKGTTIGGLSGIDYNPELNEYYLICDDRSFINPARFYTAKIFSTLTGIDSVAFTGVTTLRQINDSSYPGTKQDPANTPDPEALRYHPLTKHFIWSNEGERIITKDRTVIANPSIIEMNANGKFMDSFILPSQLYMQATETGPRQNGVLEGLTFGDEYQSLYVSVEEPLYDDGPRAGLKDTSAWIRIIKYNTATKKPVAQYAYKLDPVAYPSNPADAFMVNGVPDILWLSKNKLLVIERSFSVGRAASTIKVFMADFTGASNISAVPSLKVQPPSKPVSKQLLLNMDSLGIYIDNVEGVTFGPRLPNGHQTLIFVADNNFSELEKTQFFLFEVIP